MLHVTADPPTSTLGRDKYLSDERRQIRFTTLGTLAMGTIQAFRLEWQHHTLVVTTQMANATDSHGNEYALYSNPSLDATAAKRFDIPVWRTLSPTEESEALHIAAECIVVYGWGYNGISSPSGAFRVHTPQGELTLSSFAGYTS
jgi:hypothetical protein